MKIAPLLLLMFFMSHTHSKDYTVEMLNKDGTSTMVFKPSVLKISKGDRVTFIPRNNGHNTKSVFVPSKNLHWKSKTNQKYSMTFNSEGTYIYECTNHAIMGMAGIIQVGKSVNERKVNQFVKRYRKKIIMNKNRLKSYLDKLL